MQLTSQQRGTLRQAMVDVFFDQDALSLFVEDHLDVDPTKVVPTADSFEVHCQKLIKWLESQGKIDAFCHAIQIHHPNPKLKLTATEIMAVTAGSMNVRNEHTRPFLINNRLLLNRKELWEKLKVFAAGNSNIDRVLIVTGDTATGKTYSQYLISHIFLPKREDCQFTLIDLKQSTAPELDGMALAQWISDRSWPMETAEGKLQRFDDLAQAPRQMKNIGELLVERLTVLKKPTWLLIDGLNTVRVDKSAISLLVRLCHAIELSECPNLWLILIGIDPEHSDHSEFQSLGNLIVDKASRPELKDIKDYLTWFVTDLGGTLPTKTLEKYANQLDAMLSTQLTHDSWRVFHAELINKCQGIRKEVLR
jgi:hypothetical protein